MFKLTDLFPKPTAGQAPEAAPGKEEPKIELPPLFESPEPCEFPSQGGFTPDLDFGRYWRLNYSLLSAEEPTVLPSVSGTTAASENHAEKTAPSCVRIRKWKSNGLSLTVAALTRP